MRSNRGGGGGGGEAAAGVLAGAAEAPGLKGPRGGTVREGLQIPPVETAIVIESCGGGVVRVPLIGPFSTNNLLPYHQPLTADNQTSAHKPPAANDAHPLTYIP